MLFNYPNLIKTAGGIKDELMQLTLRPGDENFVSLKNARKEISRQLAALQRPGMSDADKSKILEDIKLMKAQINNSANYKPIKINNKDYDPNQIFGGNNLGLTQQRDFINNSVKGMELAGGANEAARKAGFMDAMHALEIKHEGLDNFLSSRLKGVDLTDEEKNFYNSTGPADLREFVNAQPNSRKSGRAADLALLSNLGILNDMVTDPKNQNFATANALTQQKLYEAIDKVNQVRRKTPMVYPGSPETSDVLGDDPLLFSGTQHEQAGTRRRQLPKGSTERKLQEEQADRLLAQKQINARVEKLKSLNQNKAPTQAPPQVLTQAPITNTPLSSAVPEQLKTVAPSSTTEAEVSKAIENNPSIVQKLENNPAIVEKLENSTAAVDHTITPEKQTGTTSTPEIAQALKANPGILGSLTKGQMAGGAALLAALGGGAYMYKKHRDKKRGEAEAAAAELRRQEEEAAELRRQEEAAAAIMAAKNLSEAQRRKLMRNLGIGAGTALGSYGLYRALR